ncbi:MAG: putative RNA-binding protein containing KH domain, possibly ribosomal protein [halophilic archaeon J07HX5]|jgi:Predicted RNA-binding protein containing KH domain, possibly ribosomal protein|nr:MAG: putative RNA-binding protein containing KH domain, possibly ribosomal protein [halophilic archaeon J07HX5]
MSSPNQASQSLDITVWVGKRGPEAVTDELDDQLSSRDSVKVKFLRAARAGPDTDTETLATELADHVGGTVIETRGHTAIIDG